MILISQIFTAICLSIITVAFLRLWIDFKNKNL